jgi:hypothetical protein
VRPVAIFQEILRRHPELGDGIRRDELDVRAEPLKHYVSVRVTDGEWLTT